MQYPKHFLDYTISYDDTLPDLVYMETPRILILPTQTPLHVYEVDIPIEKQASILYMYFTAKFVLEWEEICGQTLIQLPECVKNSVSVARLQVKIQI